MAWFVTALLMEAKAPPKLGSPRPAAMGAKSPAAMGAKSLFLEKSPEEESVHEL